MTLRLRLWGRGAVFFATMEIARRPRLTAMSLLGMGLVFEGLRDSGRSKPGTTGFYRGMGNWRFAAARAMPPPLKSTHGSTRPEMGYPNTDE